MLEGNTTKTLVTRVSLSEYIGVLLSNVASKSIPVQKIAI